MSDTPSASEHIQAAIAISERIATGLAACRTILDNYQPPSADVQVIRDLAAQIIIICDTYQNTEG